MNLLAMKIMSMLKSFQWIRDEDNEKLSLFSFEKRCMVHQMYLNNSGKFACEITN